MIEKILINRQLSILQNELDELVKLQFSIQNSYIIKILMEEKSIICDNSFQTSLSDWKLRHNMYQTNRNYRQLQSRINILQLEKKRKLKDIENKLSSHKRFVQNKIFKHQLKTSIGNRSNDQIQKSSSNSRIFQAVRQSRNMNIKTKQEQMIMTKHRMFQDVKSMRKQNQKKIYVKKLQSLEQKLGKRNRVRLIQIGWKQNIQNFWNNRLQNFQQDKKIDMSRKLKQHEENMRRLQRLEKNQQSLLDEIGRAQNVQSELQGLIQTEKLMDGDKLDTIYFSRVPNVPE